MYIAYKVQKKVANQTKYKLSYTMRLSCLDNKQVVYFKQGGSPY